MTGIQKSFLGVRVLHGVDLTVRPGEVHALVGENGAGKSTLMKILAGVYTADAGTVTLDGEPVRFGHPAAAQRAGVSTVFQEFNLLPDRTVAENVYLGREPRRRGMVDRRRMVADTRRLLEDLGVTGLSARARVRNLSVAEQQIVEIVKAMSHDARIISMDEPTAALAGREVALLYRLIERLKQLGVAVLYVSHRLKEIFDLCDRVTVLKDGALVDTSDTADLTTDDLVRKMVGRSITGFFPPKLPGTALGDVRLRVTGGGNTQLDGVDLSVRSGEIVGFAGLQGSGRTELAHALFGIAPFTVGRVEVDGEGARIRSPRQAVRYGIGLVTEDRKTQGLALNQSIAANARLVLDAVRPRSAGRAAKAVPGLLSSLELVARGHDQEVRFLSGGNQQKVVLAKWLVIEPRVMILDEPTRGIDVGAKHAVYTLIRELAAAGMAILLISSELSEVIGMADRIVVMRDGVISGELDAARLPADTAEETIMALATGQNTGAAR
ncbi:ATP-binding cassette domain-containing protein [Stackebrandtia albiflava]